MAEAKGKTCDRCKKPYSASNSNSCCPHDCELCEIKNCSEADKCQCGACTCGCQEENVLKKGVKHCKESDCVGCKVICSKLQDDERCRCTFCPCGCEKAFKQGKRCHNSDSNKCSKCKEKCKDSKDGTCICYLCSCGCNGVNCQCCVRCNPETKCEGKDTCDTEEVHDKDKCPRGKCKNHPGTCLTLECMCQDKGIEKRDDLCVCLCKCQQQCPRILCEKKRGSGSNGQHGACGGKNKGACTCECTCNCNAFGKYYGKNGEVVRICDSDDNMRFYGIGGCRFKCTNCGRLCDQDRCMNWIRAIVIGLIILASLFVLRAIFPEKFRTIMTKIRATFASSPAHSGRSLNNLVGRKIPEETNVDRYPAFRPKAYAGLS